MENTKTNDKSIGAVWVRTTKANDKMLSMKLNLKPFGLEKEVELVGWLNRNKVAGDKRPDFQIEISQPRPAGTATAAPKQAPVVAQAPVDNTIL